MANHDVSNPVFNKDLRKFETTDPGHADVFNDVVEQLINNDAALAAQSNDMANDRIYYCGTTTGTNAYAVTNDKIQAYTEGLTVRVKIGTASTGASTLNINEFGAKTILDSIGNAITSGGLRTGLMYQLSYNGTNFIVLGKGGGGNATADKLLTGYNATVDSGPINGSMANQGAKTATLNCGGSYTIPAGYHNGSGKVTANSLASQLSTDTLTLASQLVSGIKAHTKSGVQVTGTATIQSLGGSEKYIKENYTTIIGTGSATVEIPSAMDVVLIYLTSTTSFRCLYSYMLRSRLTVGIEGTYGATSYSGYSITKINDTKFTIKTGGSLTYTVNIYAFNL